MKRSICMHRCKINIKSSTRGDKAPDALQSISDYSFRRECSAGEDTSRDFLRNDRMSRLETFARTSPPALIVAIARARRSREMLVGQRSAISRRPKLSACSADYHGLARGVVNRAERVRSASPCATQ